MAKINKIKEQPKVATEELSIEDKIRAEAEALAVPTIPNGSWNRLMIYDIRFSDTVKEAATFNRTAPSIVSGFTLRLAIVGYIPPPPAEQSWVTTLSVKDPNNIHLPLEGLNVRTFLVLNDFKLKFAKIQTPDPTKPGAERSAIIAYAKYFEEKLNIPILVGLEMLVKFVMRNKSKMTLKDFGLQDQQVLPESGLGVVFECYKISSSYEKDGKKGWNTEFTTYDKDKKVNVDAKVIVVSEEQVDAVYAKMVELEEKAKSKSTKKGGTDFPYGANVKDELSDGEVDETEAAVDSLIASSDELD
jgi:hypothetical protein